MNSRKVSVAAAVLAFLQLAFIDRLQPLDFFNNTPRLPILVGLTGMLFFYLCVAEDRLQRTWPRLLAVATLAVAFTSIFLFWASHDEDHFLFAQIPLILAVGLLFHRSLFAMDDRATWNWQNAFSKTVIESVFVGLAFAVSMGLLVYLVEFVFDVTAPTTVYELIIKLAATVVPSLVFLKRIEVERASLRRFDIGVIKYVLVPLWAIYVLFLNIYALRILIHWSLPKGMVAVPVSIAFILFALIWWSPTPLKKKPDYIILYISSVWMVRWLNLTLLLLFWIAAGRRIYDYGLTQPRYFLVLLGVLFSGMTYLDLRRQLTGRWFSALLLLLLCLSLIKAPFISGARSYQESNSSPSTSLPRQSLP